MLTSGRRWEKRHSLLLALSVRLLALLVTVGMVFHCIITGVWIVAIWKLMPQLILFYPNLQAVLILELVVMVFATLLTLFALVCGTLALRALHASPTK